MARFTTVAISPNDLFEVEKVVSEIIEFYYRWKAMSEEPKELLIRFGFPQEGVMRSHGTFVIIGILNSKDGKFFKRISEKEVGQGDVTMVEGMRIDLWLALLSFKLKQLLLRESYRPGDLLVQCDIMTKSIKIWWLK